MGTSSLLRSRRFGVLKGQGTRELRDSFGRHADRARRQTIQTLRPADSPNRGFGNTTFSQRSPGYTPRGIGLVPVSQVACGANGKGTVSNWHLCSSSSGFGQTAGTRVREFALARAPRYRHPEFRLEDPGKWHPADASATAGCAPLNASGRAGPCATMRQQAPPPRRTGLTCQLGFGQVDS